MNKQYVYILLNPLKPGVWLYEKIKFDFQPIYAGIGLGYRYRAHYSLKKNKSWHNEIKYRTIKKLIENGTPPICVKIYEDISREKAIKIEISFIKKFGKIIDGTGILTNISDGGDTTVCNKIGADNIHSKKVYQYTLSGKFKKEWDCLREIGRKIKKSYNNIGDCCRGKTKTSYGYQWFYEFKGNKINSIKTKEQHKRRKKVYKFDNAGNLVSEYESLTDACFKHKMQKYSLSQIILKTGFYKSNFFSYDINFKPKIKNNSKICKIEHDGKIMFLTNSEIQKMFNVSKFYLSDVKRNRFENPKFKIIP